MHALLCNLNLPLSQLQLHVHYQTMHFLLQEAKKLNQTPYTVAIDI